MLLTSCAMALEVLKCDMDRISGHVTAQVRVVERVEGHAPTYGPLETVGIDHQSLTVKYGCAESANSVQVAAAIKAWLAEHHVGALARKRALDQRSTVVAGMAGKTLTFEPPAEPVEPTKPTPSEPGV